MVNPALRAKTGRALGKEDVMLNLEGKVINCTYMAKFTSLTVDNTPGLN